jgi:hypothetical protein
MARRPSFAATAARKTLSMRASAKAAARSLKAESQHIKLKTGQVGITRIS